MTVTHRMFRAIALLGLVALLAPGCRRPESPMKERPAAKREKPSPGVDSLPEIEPADDDVVFHDDDTNPRDVTILAREIEPAPTPLVGELRPLLVKKPHAPREIDLRTRLHRMRRSVDRRLLWARRSTERQAFIEAERDRLAEGAAAWDLAARVPRGTQTESLGAALQKSADSAGLTLSDLAYEIVPPQVDRLPDSFAGDKPLDLNEVDLIGTIHISFVLGTEDTTRLAAWYNSVETLPRFLLVNRLRHTGEAFQVLADAYYLADREGPTRRELDTNINTELQKAGILLPAEEVRQQDPEHFLLATEISINALSELIDQANVIAGVEAGNMRSEVVHGWYEDRLKVRADRTFEALLP
ncbi:MAG: hypothetical protein ABIK09_20010 [Pseudomonadota bacterium]